MDTEQLIEENIRVIDEITFDSMGNVICIKFNSRLEPPITIYGDNGPITYADWYYEGV